MQHTPRSGKIAAVLAVCLVATACQSSGTGDAQLQQADLNVAQTDPNAVPGDPAAAQTASTDAGQVQPAHGQPAQGQLAQGQLAMSAPGLPGQCAIQLAGGPPPKPAKGADFGKAAAKNVGKNVTRNLITIIGGQVGGQIGAAAASGVANSEIRAEQDIKGTWQITDGNMGCACQIEIGGIWKIQGKGKDKGSIKTIGCSSPLVQRIANWALGYSFTGYNAKFELKAKDNRTVLATMNRDGVHYFSGAMADGTPVVLWRDKQNYSSFKKPATQ